MAPPLLRFLLISVLAVFFKSNAVLGQGSILSLEISTNIVYRFATTSVRSVIANAREGPDEVMFLYHMPKEAFVSNFSMTISGVEYSGRLEGFESKRLYRPPKKNEAEDASLRIRGTNTFKFKVQVPARSEVTFDLIYNELLKRRLGAHRHVVYLDPGQVVPNLNISVSIIESKALTIMNVPPIEGFTKEATSNELVNRQAVLNWGARNAVDISYNPSTKEQREKSPRGIRGKFMVNYDVARTSDAGQLQVINGYFVHYFAPAGYRPLPRRVVFVLDVSGSMQGEKIIQLKEAMSSILNELKAEDMFNIIVFSSGVTRWQRSLVSATASNKNAALRWFQQDVQIDGLTNINDALTYALSDLQTFKQSSPDDQGIPYILFLTDGDPTAGERDLAKLLQNVRQYNTYKTSIFSIGFGNDVKIPFLQRISLQNGGFARKIYATSGASLQLQGFFNEISSPLLTDIKITYTGNMVDETTVTRTNYNMYFNGSEIVVTGRLRVPTTTGITSSVIATSRYGPMNLSKKSSSTGYGLKIPSVTILNQNMERMWAYSIIKDTVRRAFESDNRVDRATLRRRTRDLSLRYNIMSPATILIAPKPDSAGEIIDIIQADSPRPDPEDSRDPGPDPQGKPDYPKQTVPEPEYPKQDPTVPGYPEFPEYPQPGQPSRPRPEYPRPTPPPRPEGERPKYPESPTERVTLPELENEAEPFTDIPGYPSRPGYPEVPTYPATSRPPSYPTGERYAERPDPASPGSPEGYPSRPEQLPGRPGEPAFPERPGYPKTPEPATPGYPSRPDYPPGPDSGTPERPGTPSWPETPGRPEPRPGYPQTPGGPVPEGPDYPQTPGRPEPERPGYPQTPGGPVPEGPGYPQTPGRPEPGRPGYPQTPGGPGPEGPGYPQTPGRPEPERPGYPQTPGGPEPERPGYPQTPGRPEPEQPGYPQTPGGPEPERPGYPETPGRPGDPQTPGGPEIERPGYPYKPGGSEPGRPGYPEAPRPGYPYPDNGRPKPDLSREEVPEDPRKPLTQKQPQTGADSDPHIILDVKNLNDEFVCFDIFGTPGDIYQLLSDPVKKINVNAIIIPRRYHDSTSVKHQATYFGRVGLTYKNTRIAITPDRIIIDGASYNWQNGGEFNKGDLGIKVVSGPGLQIKIGRDITFMVLSHTQDKNHKLKTPYVGFYLIDTKGLSPYTGGILGEFLNLRVTVDISHDQAERFHVPGQLTRIDQSRARLTVYAGRRLNMATDKKVKCWHVRNSGRGLLKKKLKQYLVPHLA